MWAEKRRTETTGFVCYFFEVTDARRLPAQATARADLKKHPDAKKNDSKKPMALPV